MAKKDCRIYVADRYGTVAEFSVSARGWQHAVARAKKHGDAAVGLRCPAVGANVTKASLPLVKCRKTCRVHVSKDPASDTYALAGRRKTKRKTRKRRKR